MPVKRLCAKKRLCSNLLQLKTLLPQVTNTWLVVGSLLDLRSRAWLPLNSLCASSFWVFSSLLHRFSSLTSTSVFWLFQGKVIHVRLKRCAIKACCYSRPPALYVLNVEVCHLIVLIVRPWSSLLLWESNTELLGEAQVLPCSSSH